MNDRRERAAEIAAMWKDVGGGAWVAARALLDETFRPLEHMLTEIVAAAGARNVLDVGCGTGATTVAAARRLGPSARVVGIDISEAMLEAARARAREERVAVEFRCADAQDYAFDPGGFDLLISRFGVMFFADPVSAFANLQRACGVGASLRCMVWRSAEENPFMTVAERAAEPLLPGVLRQDPDEPGQFGLAQREFVVDVLQRSGWTEIELEPIDIPCEMPVSELHLYVSRLGPVSRALQEKDEALRRAVMERVLPAFDPYVQNGAVRFVSACWMLGAKKAR